MTIAKSGSVTCTGLNCQSNDVNDPVYQKYKQFQDRTTREMLERIRKLVDSKRKKVAISTYHTHQVDIVRNESNTAINQPHPVWLYSASENVASIENSWDDKLISNCCINAIDLFYRFTGVSRHEVKIRLYESLASGSGLDFCIIGVFDGYPDRENFADVKQIYRFHKKYEHYYGNLQTAADIALIKPENLYSKQQSKEYLGIFKMLKERHVQFDVIMQSRLPAQLPKHEYKAVIIPDITAFNEEELRTLAAAQSKGAILFATGQSLSADGANRRFFSDAFQASVESVEQNVRAAYAYTADKGVFKHFAARDWAIVDGVFALTRFEETVQKPLVYVEPATFGPPERASGHRLSAYAAAGIATHQDGSPRAVYLPWNVGELYYRYGYEDHKHILLDLLDFTLDETYVLKANAPQGVEIFFNRIAGGKYLLQMVNLTGFNGVTYAEPLPVRNIEVSLRSLKADGDVVDLVGQRVSVNSDGHDMVITLEELGDYAAIVIPAGGGQK